MTETEFCIPDQDCYDGKIQSLCALLGKPPRSKTDEFLENFRKGGRGVISDLKNFIANLVLVRLVYGKKLQYIFQKMGGGVKGRSEIFRKFIRFGERWLSFGLAHSG